MTVSELTTFLASMMTNYADYKVVVRTLDTGEIGDIEISEPLIIVDHKAQTVYIGE